MDNSHLGEAQGDDAEGQCPIILVLKSGGDRLLGSDVCLARGVLIEWCVKR